MKKSINKFLKLFVNIIIFIITLIILFLLYRLISSKVFHKPYTDFLGYSAFEIATGSMEPSLNVKDIIIVKKEKNYQEGQIITYTDNDDMITHRIIEVHDNYVVTKGDANNTIDPNVSLDRIIGKSVFVFAKGGLIREMFITPKVILSVLVTMILINIYLSIKPKPKLVIAEEKSDILIDDNIKMLINEELMKNIDKINNEVFYTEEDEELEDDFIYHTVFNMRPLDKKEIQKELMRQKEKQEKNSDRSDLYV